MRSLIELALALDEDVEAEIVESGQALLDRARAGGYDAILLDALMPGLDGYETCRRLKADPVTRELPVVFLSGSTRRAEIARALDAGAAGCLTKPFNVRSLAAELRVVLAK